MLWRVILSAIAISCTLSRTHAHGPRDRIKDLMCVLLLSGMQKEDLDVSMLNKLQRFNVNIHDANNDELLQECITLRNKSGDDTMNTTLAYVTTDGVTEIVLKGNASATDIQTKPVKSDKNMSIQSYTNTKTNNDAIQYTDGEPKMDSVLKFWNDMKLEQKETTEATKNNNFDRMYESKNKRNVQDMADEEDDIKRLLENYFSQRKNNRNKKHTKATTTQRGFMDNMYKDLIQRQNKNYFEPDRNLPYLMPLGGQNSSPLRIIPDKDEAKPFERNFSDVVAAFGGFNRENEDKIKYPKEKRKVFENPFARSFMEGLVSTTEKERQKFSNDMIKEIADSVKELVLRDLKLKIQETTTTSTTQTTQTTRTTESIKDNNIKIQASVLNKFIEMFEEFKSMKKDSVIISSSNNRQNVKLLPPILPYGKIREGMPQIQYNNPFGQYPKSSQIFNFGPQEHKFRTNEAIVTMREPSKNLVPITFQTNNLEIPPLGIPIDKPLNPINQNIVVTTITPYRIGVIKNELRPRNNPFEEQKKIKHIPKLTHITKTHDNYNVASNDDGTFTLNNGVKHTYYEKRHSNYNPRPGNTYIKTPESPRFHERLENTDFFDVPEKKRYTDRVDCCNEKYAYSKQMVECCNRKIASRQQLSLNNMKKGSYDDTHFKNFLKTQQKVTDMLERILTTRDKVRSVETS